MYDTADDPPRAGNGVQTAPLKVVALYYGTAWSANDTAYLNNLIAGISSNPWYNSIDGFYNRL